MTILMQQLYAGNINMASRLVVRGANVNYVNRNGQTALHMCVMNMKKDAVKFLI